MLVNLYANDLFAEIFETGENNDGKKRDFEIFERMTFLKKVCRRTKLCLSKIRFPAIPFDSALAFVLALNSSRSR